MTQQVEITGNSQKAVAALGGAADHGKKATKGLFSKLLNLVKQRSAEKEASPKEASTVPAADKHQGSASLKKKPALLSPKSSLIEAKHKVKGAAKPEEQGQASVAEASTVVINTRILSAKSGKTGQGLKNEQAFPPVANKSSKQAAHGQQTQTGIHAYGRADKLDAADMQSLTNKHRLYSGAKIQVGEALQSMIGVDIAAAKTQPKGPALQDLISPGDIANAAKAGSKELYTASQDIITDADRKGVASRHRLAPVNAKAALGNLNTTANKRAHVEPTSTQKIPVQHISSQPANSQQQAASASLSESAPLSNPVKDLGKQATASNRTHGENHAGRVATASQDIIASAGWKSIASQHGAAPVTAKAASGKLNAIKNKGAHAAPTSAQKASIQHISSQQTSKQQHAAISASISAPAPSSSPVEGLANLLDSSSISTKYGQSTSELHIQQTIISEPAQTVQTQSNKAVLPQTQPGSGPWSIAAAMQEIGHAASQERYRLELNLDPAHLGKIKVYLDSDANKQIQVHLVIDQSASRQIIEQHLPGLRQSLAQHGLDMGGFSMDSQHNQDDQPSSSRHAQSDYAVPVSNMPLQATEPHISNANARLSIRV